MNVLMVIGSAVLDWNESLSKSLAEPTKNGANYNYNVIDREGIAIDCV